MRREKEFRQQCCRNSTKMRREKAEEFRQHCYRNSSAQNAARSVKKKAIAATPLPKKEKKNCFGSCGNAIAENGKKKLWNLWMSKKKSCYVYNIFTINYTWLIIISSKNLWQINCGNGITENVKKKKKKNLFWQFWQSHCR